LKAKIIELVEQNYTDPNFDVNKLCELLGICRNYLYTRIQFDFLCSPHYYIETLRIEKAKSLLLNGFKIIEVCKKTGYSNRKTFYLAFKKRTKMTPKEFVEKSN